MIELFPFQLEGSAFLKSKRHALLADEMGVGKTPQAIDAARELDKVLVVCPAVAKYNWQAEFLKFDDRPSFIDEGGQFHLQENTRIISFNHLNNHLKLYTDVKWDAVIIDEGHLLKEPTALRTKAALGNKGLIHNTKRFWVLSGTPAPNHAGELWVLLYTFGMTKLSYDGFIARYCTAHRLGHYARLQITGSNTKHTHELKALLKKCSLRRLKKDVLDLPPMFHNTFYIKGDNDDILKYAPGLKEKLQREYEMLAEKLNFDVGLPADDKLISALQLMSQSVSSVRRYHGFLKVRPVVDLIRSELERDLYKKIIIFGIHTDVLNLLEQFFVPLFRLVKVVGATPPKARKAAQDRFQSDPNIRIFIGNIDAAGTNLTLTAATQVLFIEQDWVPGNNKQAADRAHRFGQTQSVSVRHVAIKGSIDAKITATLTRKVQEISTFID